MKLDRYEISHPDCGVIGSAGSLAEAVFIADKTGAGTEILDRMARHGCADLWAWDADPCVRLRILRHKAEKVMA